MRLLWSNFVSFNYASHSHTTQITSHAKLQQRQREKLACLTLSSCIYSIRKVGVRHPVFAFDLAAQVIKVRSSFMLSHLS